MVHRSADDEIGVVGVEPEFASDFHGGAEVHVDQPQRDLGVALDDPLGLGPGDPSPLEHGAEGVADLPGNGCRSDQRGARRGLQERRPFRFAQEYREDRGSVDNDLTTLFHYVQLYKYNVGSAIGAQAVEDLM